MSTLWLVVVVGSVGDLIVQPTRHKKMMISRAQEQVLRTEDNHFTLVHTVILMLQDGPHLAET